MNSLANKYRQYTIRIFVRKKKEKSDKMKEPVDSEEEVRSSDSAVVRRSDSVEEVRRIEVRRSDSVEEEYLRICAKEQAIGGEGGGGYVAVDDVGGEDVGGEDEAPGSSPEAGGGGPAKSSWWEGTNKGAR